MVRVRHHVWEWRTPDNVTQQSDDCEIPILGESNGPLLSYTPAAQQMELWDESARVDRRSRVCAGTVQAMGDAFDQAWARIAPTFGNIPQEVEAARLMLAEAMLSVTAEGDADIEDLQDRAIIAMAMDYRSRRE